MQVSKLRTLLFWSFILCLIIIPVKSQEEGFFDDSKGMIAYVGEDDNIYTREIESEIANQLTSDATTIRRYQWPTWSRDGRLAYFCCDVQYSDDFAIEVFVSEDGIQPGQSVYTSDTQSITYAYWSPRVCNSDECWDLAVLVSNPATQGFLVELIDGNVALSSETMGIGAPFYYSWNPSGTQIVAHRNSSTVEIYDIETDEFITVLSENPGAFQAPAWSPVDDRVLFGERNPENGTTDLVVVANGNAQTLVENLSGNVSFLWSPDGNHIAYRVADAERISELYVVDALTGELVSSSVVSGVLAFFWSPDSQRIAYITLETPPGTFSASIESTRQTVSYAQNITSLAWSVLDVANNANQLFSTFVPTNEMIYMLIYFDQFAQSHQIWSPHSDHIVYSERTDPTTSLINILDVTQPDTVPITIANGKFAVWSYQQP